MGGKKGSRREMGTWAGQKRKWEEEEKVGGGGEEEMEKRK